MKRTIVAAAILMMAAFTNIKGYVHCQEDKDNAERIIATLGAKGGKISDMMLPAAEMLVGKPYAETTQNDSVGKISVDFHSFDDIDFLNTVVALAKTAAGYGKNIVEYEQNLENVSRRGGVDKGFVSKMLYGAEWIGDNIYRGNVKEMFPGNVVMYSKTKSLDYVTRHREDYKALKDSATFDDMVMVEFGFRSHKINHLKRESISKREVADDLRDGDIIFLMTNVAEKDVYLTGIVARRDDGFHIIYSSEKDGKVVESEETLDKMMKNLSKYVYGYRWIRVTD